MSSNTKCLNCGYGLNDEVFMAADTSENIYRYVRCRQCGLVFISPHPETSVIEKTYESEYYGEGETEKFNNKIIVRMIDRFSAKRAGRFANHLKSGARILDVGCGNGRFLEHLHSQKRQFELNGIEISARAALRASTRLKAKAWIHTVTDIQQFFGKQSFDGISFVHVFEHLSNPSEMLDQLEVVIRPEGTVMIVIPNICSRQAKKYKQYWFHLDPPRHLHFYPPLLLKEEMIKRGFECVFEKYHDAEQNPYGAVQSMLNLITDKRDVLFERLKGNRSYAHFYGWFRIALMKLFWLGIFPFCFISDRIAALRRKGATVEFIFRKSPKEDRKNSIENSK